ncbi:hypothetical protein P167DRAFT_22570 [Morchella conica CCBAS932]|uniref:Uncharacterized protein n=1 Tax=Morchella conica CCBAS932 TaxID=1392247 RepID=A0A3N4KXM8_9PEZI|nr:hypothetical protein P167DRAFT_22570 [Morchella conica CCBAS932]
MRMHIYTFLQRSFFFSSFLNWIGLDWIGSALFLLGVGVTCSCVLYISSCSPRRLLLCFSSYLFSYLFSFDWMDGWTNIWCIWHSHLYLDTR